MTIMKDRMAVHKNLDKYKIPEMATPELIKLQVEMLGELTERGEALVAKTDRGRGLQSAYFAIRYQMNKRGEGLEI